MAKNNKDGRVEPSHENVEKLRPNVEKLHDAGPHKVNQSYPREARELAVEILRIYKERLRISLGKGQQFGWKLVKDIVVKTVNDRYGNDKASILQIHHFNDWDRGRSIPSNEHFEIIDNFIKMKEISGEFSHIRKEINRVRHRHRRIYFEQLFRSAYRFSDKNPEKYSQIVEELSDSFWISQELHPIIYKQFLFYIGNIEEFSFDVIALYFPYRINLDHDSWNLQNVFASGGVLTIDTLKGVRPETGSRLMTPYHFGDSFTVLLFREENRGGEDAAFTTAELTLDQGLDQGKLFRIRWPRTIVAPSSVDYSTLTGLPDGDPRGRQTAPDSPRPTGPQFENPIAKSTGSIIYIGFMHKIVEEDKIRKIRDLFWKFEV